jgi:SHS2 domain-containing protein
MLPGQRVIRRKRGRRLYEILEHTADLRIRVRAGDLKELFSRTAQAMFSLIAEKKTRLTVPRRQVRIRLKAATLDELFIAWLNELLSLAYSRKLIFDDLHINRLSEHALDASVAGRSSGDFIINKEIKAATYHQLQISRDRSGWKTEVVFDV